MTKNKHAFIQGVVINRKNLIELIVVAILLAFGVNLIAGHILTVLSPLASTSIGAVLCLGSLLYLAARLFGRRVESRTYEAFLIYNYKKNELILVPGYVFSERICEYMEGAFVENPALKTLWGKEPLKDLFDKTNDKLKRHKSAQLLSEAAEYFVLDKLSTHLTDYFNVENFKKENLKEYGRKDIPEVLLTNRFLEMFSRPMEDRPAFVDNTFKGKGHGEIVRAYGPGGAIYDRFDLVLPKKSIVQRPEDNKIEIETKKLKMSITVRFEGFCTVLPAGFEQYYLGINDWQDITEYSLSIDIQVLIKLGALLSGVGWEYYRWVDSFLDKIEGDLSEDAFFRRLGWESVSTVLRCLNLPERNKAKTKKK